MNRIALAGMLLAATISSASALEWQGDLFITKSNAACRNEGFEVNQFFRSVLQPAGAALGNDTNTRLSLIGQRNAQRIFLQNDVLDGSGPYNGTFITSRAGFASWTDGTFSGAKLKPATLATSTPSIIVKVTINKFANIVGCSLTLEGTLGQRPDEAS
jgi:hypothetical protein